MDATYFISAHLSQEQKHEIAIEEWRAMCRDAFNGDPERVIGNFGHRLAREMVADALGDTADELITAKAISVIENLSDYTVFHSPSVWEREASPSWRILQKAIEANSELVAERVRHHLHNLSKNDALELIKSARMTLDLGKLREGRE